MSTFDFKLILTQPTLDEAEAEQIYARCDDATLITDADHSYLDFDRQAASLEEAIRSAVADVEAAGFAVQRIEVERQTLAVTSA